MSGSPELAGNHKAYLLSGTVQAVTERAGDLEPATISPGTPQAPVLFWVKVSREPMTLMGPSRMMKKKPHTLSSLLKRMEARGPVSTKKDVRKKTRVRVSLANEGQETMKLRPTVTRAPGVFSCLSKKEIVALHVINGKPRKGGRTAPRDGRRTSFRCPGRGIFVPGEKEISGNPSSLASQCVYTMVYHGTLQLVGPPEKDCYYTSVPGYVKTPCGSSCPTVSSRLVRQD